MKHLVPKTKYVRNQGIFYAPMEIRVSLLNPERILHISSGEVLNSNTININTLEPEKDGLFCNKIFKANNKKNYVCTICFFRQDHPYRCINCGSNTRLDRSNTHNLSMGHIELKVPIAHPWFSKTKIIHVLYENIDSLYGYDRINHILEYAPEKIYHYFKQMDILAHYFYVRNYLLHYLLNNKEITEVGNAAMLPDKKFTVLSKKMRILNTLIRQKIRPEWMFIKILPVLSPTYRPLMRIHNALFVTSDVNLLYKIICHSI